MALGALLVLYMCSITEIPQTPNSMSSDFPFVALNRSPKMLNNSAPNHTARIMTVGVWPCSIKGVCSLAPWSFETDIPHLPGTPMGW